MRFRHGFTARRVFSASLLVQIEDLSRALASANEAQYRGPPLNSRGGVPASASANNERSVF